MAELKAGDAFRDFVGPLGCPSEFVAEDIEELKKKKMVFVAGGVGTAPVYPQVKWLHEHGITADVILGAKTKDMVILEKDWEKFPIFMLLQMTVPMAVQVWLPRLLRIL